MLTVSHENEQEEFDEHWCEAIKCYDNNSTLTTFDDLIRKLQEDDFFAHFDGCHKCANVHDTDCKTSRRVDSRDKTCKVDSEKAEHAKASDSAGDEARL